MRTILHVLPHLRDDPRLDRARLLIDRLPKERFRSLIVTLDPRGPQQAFWDFSEEQPQVVAFGRWLDLGLVPRIHRVLEWANPDLVHLWRVPPLSMLGLLMRMGKLKVIGDAFSVDDQRIGPRVEYPLWQRLERIVIPSARDVETWRGRGIAHVEVISPGVTDPAAELRDDSEARGDALRRRLPRYLACVGAPGDYLGWRDAVWAFDVIRHLDDDLHLVLIGAEECATQLRPFIRGMIASHRVHLIKRTLGWGDWLTGARATWITTRLEGAVSGLLEALIRGCPVVATRRPDHAELVNDGVHGWLVAPGDKVQFARLTRLLLNDATLRDRLGQEGRRHAAACFSADALVARYVRLYDRALGDPSPA